MKSSIIIFSVLIIINIESIAQSGYLFGGGAVQQYHKTNSAEVTVKQETSKTIFIDLEYIPKDFQDFSVGFEYLHSINNSEFKHSDLRLKIGNILFGKSRIQLPIFGLIGWSQYDDQSSSSLQKYSGISYGGKGGIRFYITNNLSLGGYYTYSIMEVLKIDDDNLDDSLGKITTTSFNAGILYHFN